RPVAILRCLLPERRSGDEEIDVRRPLKHLWRDACSGEGLGDLDHFRHPAIGLWRQDRKLAERPIIEIALRLPQLLFQYVIDAQALSRYQYVQPQCLRALVE